MKDLLTRIKTLSTTFVTYAVLGSTAATFAIGYLPDNAPATVAKVLAGVASFLTAAVAIVRKVTPVIDKEVGLLPVDYPTPVKSVDPPKA